ncbi:LHCP [Ectocarpus sp. CCAP 1310/34]|nr:LHCP [Ectocarpus sp. CCAP 1310/34]
MKMSFESEIGAQPPIGFWDPLGLVTDADQERFDRLRYVEIKHGRIAMLAVAGHLTQQNYRLPGMLSFKDNISFEDVPNGLAAFSKIPPLGTLQIILAIGVHELFVVKQVEGSFPGDCTTGGNIFQSAWDNMSEETQASKRAIELNNGRAAQMGILAMMVHEQLSNQPYIINDLVGAAYKFN